MEIKKVKTSNMSNLIFVDSDKGFESFDLKDASSLGELTSSELCELLDALIIRFKNTDAPIEEESIWKFSTMIVREFGIRIKNIEKKKTQRNKLIRYLREKIERLKK